MVVWEIFAFAKFPFGLIDPTDMKRHLAEGNRLEKPDICPTEIHELMLSCWQENQELRPEFTEIRDQLRSIINNSTLQYGYIEIENEISE